jgi:hypothetical protein
MLRQLIKLATRSKQPRKVYKIFLARPACVLIFASLHALEAGEENGIVFVVPVIAELRASWDSGQRHHDGQTSRSLRLDRFTAGDEPLCEAKG